MKKERKVSVEKTLSKDSLNNQKSDFAYWQSQPYQARLAALEQIRREHYQWKQGNEPRMDKVYSIIKL